MKRLVLWLLYFAIAFPTSHYGFIAFGEEHQILAWICIFGMNMVTAKMLLFSRTYRE